MLSLLICNNFPFTGILTTIIGAVVLLLENKYPKKMAKIFLSETQFEIEDNEDVRKFSTISGISNISPAPTPFHQVSIFKVNSVRVVISLSQLYVMFLCFIHSRTAGPSGKKVPMSKKVILSHFCFSTMLELAKAQYCSAPYIHNVLLAKTL